jgi:hypothetical protein
VHDDHRWATLRELDRLPMSTPQRRIVQVLGEAAGGRQLDLLTKPDRPPDRR